MTLAEWVEKLEDNNKDDYDMGELEDILQTFASLTGEPWHGNDNVCECRVCAALPPKCTECAGKGWNVFDIDSTMLLQIQRCDACEKFPNDKDAQQFVMRQILKGGRR